MTKNPFKNVVPAFVALVAITVGSAFAQAQSSPGAKCDMSEAVTRLEKVSAQLQVTPAQKEQIGPIPMERAPEDEGVEERNVSNPPWFPSLMAFEHYDSARTHVFQQARFGGSYGNNKNQVAVRTAPFTYPTGYNMVYLNPDEVFLYGGGYGNISNATGAFVAKVDPKTLEPVWCTQLINTVEANEWDYPGVLSILDDGLLYVIYGYRLAKLDPSDGHVVGEPLELPTGKGLKENTSFNGFDALPDHTLIAKSLYREAGCPAQGPPALFQGEPPMHCPDPTDVPPSILVTIDPKKMMVLDQVELPAPVVGRPTTARFRDKNYVYLATNPTPTKPGTAIRYQIQDGQFTTHDTPDPSWNTGNIYQPNQTAGSAVVMMNDWFVVQTNSGPTTEPLSVIVINQADASQQFSTQPFKGLGYPTSWAPMSVSVDPKRNLIYTIDSSAGVIGALELTANDLHTVWTAQQRTTEFVALIGPPGRRVLVGTDIPPGQQPRTNTTDFVVWRDAQTGQELARSEQLPAMTSGAMVQPYYFGKMFYCALNDGELIELDVRPGSGEDQPM